MGKPVNYRRLLSGAKTKERKTSGMLAPVKTIINLLDFVSLAIFSISALAPVLLCTTSHAQANNEWTWMGGTNFVTFNEAAVSPATAGTPAIRPGAATATDNTGNFWLFGGSYGGFPVFNDLWEFSPSGNRWTWRGGNDAQSVLSSDGNNAGQKGAYGILGTPSPANMPGSRTNAAAWTDANGNFWLFGGAGFDSAGTYGYLNDLWEFNVSTNQWTWMGGSNTLPGSNQGWGNELSTLGKFASGNIPGGKTGASAWRDNSGHLWLFGGDGYNDLWEFDPAKGEWAWMAGGNNTIGTYGSFQTPASGNAPGGRAYPVSWIDSHGDFWIFGGLGFDSQGNYGILNDLWEFQPSINEWAWISGNETLTCSATSCNQPSVFGTLQVPAPGNVPGSRDSAVGWTDSNGHLWLFGGYDYDLSGVHWYLNDFWEFDPSINQWAWMGGSSTSGDQPGNYGTEGVPGLSNSPGGRESGAGWTDSNGNFWLFGGIGFDSYGSFGILNDFWEFNLSTGGLPNTATPVLSLDGGTYSSIQTLTITDSTPGASIYYLLTGITPPSFPSDNGSISATPYTGPITVSSTETIYAIADASGHANSPVAGATYILNVPQADMPTLSPYYGTYSTPQTVTMTDATPNATIYYTTDGSTPSINSKVYSGPITVASSESIETLVTAPGYANSEIPYFPYTILSPATAIGEWTWISGSATPNCLPNESHCGIPGVYGTLGVPAAANIPSGRLNAASWTDKNGNFWLFGGEGFDTASTDDETQLNDLWEFIPSTGEWVWMGGSSTVGAPNEGFPGVYGTMGKASASNIPGSRSSSISWVDSSGNFWLFGGYGFDSGGETGGLNDVWMFNPSTKMWTWVSGSNTVAGAQSGVYGTLGTPSKANLPGGRAYAVSWTDASGNLWLFGGIGYDANSDLGNLNDLWEFNPSTGEWTWMSGSSVMPILSDVTGTTAYGSVGNYGVKGIFGPANIPGGREYAAGWTDASGSLWLFGGSGVDARGFPGGLNDVWEYKPSIGQWAWMGGADEYGELGFYGTEGISAASNSPGAITGATAWSDKGGHDWFFGGSGLNNLWAFYPSSNEWAWVSGSQGTSAVGSEGIPGLSSVTNAPSGRGGASAWSDTSGNIWVFGGGSAGFVYFNDLWEYKPYSSNLPVTATPTFSLATGTYTSAQSVTISDTTPGATIYYSINGSSPATLYTGPIAVSSTETITATALAGNYAGSAATSTTYTINITLPQSFTLGAFPTQLTVSPGGQATTTLSVTPQNGFSSAVSFACSGLPSGTNCSFSPAVVTPLGGTATTQLTISASSQSGALLPMSQSIFPLTVLAVMVCLFRSIRRYRSRFMILALILSGLGLVFGCGGASSATGGGSVPLPVTSTVTITATSGSIQQATPLSFTLN